jgi:hypothetical protein
LDGDDERGHVKYRWKKVGDEICVHSINSIPRTRKLEPEREIIWNPRTQTKKLITTYP